MKQESSLYFAPHYRELLLLAMGRVPGKKVRFSDLADAIRVQRPYLSKVMRGKAELNRDQLFLACRFLALSKEEANFASLLLERDRSALAERRKEIENEIEEIRLQHREIRKNLQAEAAQTPEENLSRYYLDPLLLLTHIGLTVPQHQSHPEILRHKLGLGRERFQSILSELAEIGLIRLQKGKARLLKDHLHLPKDSPLFQAHQALLRQTCQQRMQAERQKEDTVFSVTFSATEAVRKRLHERFLEFVRSVEQEVRDCEPTDIYQMNFDLFRWAGENR